MIRKQTIEELKEKYPDKSLFINNADNPTEIVLEIDPEAGRAIAIIEKSIKHTHKYTEEKYVVLRGELDVFIDDVKHHLKEGDAINVEPGEIHYAIGDEAWVDVTSTPPWSVEDHIIIKEGNDSTGS